MCSAQACMALLCFISVPMQRHATHLIYLIQFYQIYIFLSFRLHLRGSSIKKRESGAPCNSVDVQIEMKTKSVRVTVSHSFFLLQLNICICLSPDRDVVHEAVAATTTARTTATTTTTQDNAH